MCARTLKEQVVWNSYLYISPQSGYTIWQCCMHAAAAAAVAATVAATMDAHSLRFFQRD